MTSILRYRTSIRPLLLVLVLTLLSPCVCGSLHAQTQKKSEVVRQLESQRKKIEAEIKRISDQLTKTTGSAKSALERVTLLDRQIAARKEVVATMQREVAELTGQIDELEQQIDSLQVRFDQKQTSYVASIRALQGHRHTEDMLIFVLSAEDLAQGMRRAEYLRQYARWQRDQAEKLKALRQEIEEKKAGLQSARDEQQKLLESKRAEQKKLQADQATAQAEAKKLKGKERDLRNQIKKQQQQAAALDRKIREQIQREIEEARRKAAEEEAARRAKQGEKKAPKRKAATKDGYAMTEKEATLSKNFADNRGKLPNPLSGPSRVVSRFGRQKVAGMQYVEVDNNGIDLQGAAGARALAVFDGVVTRVFTLEGFNNSIIVRHGNYLTVYSNLTEVFVKKGDKVTTGQQLGKVYSDPDVGGATKLHFQLWKETTTLDPLPWIRH